MSAGAFVPSPITNPYHRGRSSRIVTCPTCGRNFHPWRRAVSDYCTRRCAGMARRIEAMARRKWDDERPRTREDRERARAIAAECMTVYDEMKETLT